MRKKHRTLHNADKPKTEFSALRDDIKANGLMTPITLYDGMILDGGNRYRACIDASVEPRFEDYEGDDPAHFVLSSNFFRRHLTPGQQATVVALAQDWTKAQSHGGNRRSDQVPTLALETALDRAEMSGAGYTTQRNADKLVREAPALAKKVVDGELSITKALEKIKPKPTKIVADEMRLYEEGSTTGAYVAAVRAKDAHSGEYKRPTMHGLAFYRTQSASRPAYPWRVRALANRLSETAHRCSAWASRLRPPYFRDLDPDRNFPSAVRGPVWCPCIVLWASRAMFVAATAGNL